MPDVTHWLGGTTQCNRAARRNGQCRGASEVESTCVIYHPITDYHEPTAPKTKR